MSQISFIIIIILFLIASNIDVLIMFVSTHPIQILVWNEVTT